MVKKVVVCISVFETDEPLNGYIRGDNFTLTNEMGSLVTFERELSSYLKQVYQDLVI